MALVTHFCGVCGHRVPPDDLEAGHAAILEHVTYCRDCATSAGIEEPRRPVAPAPAQPRRRASSSSPARRPAGRAAPRARAGSGAGIAVGVVLAFAAIAGIIAVLMLDDDGSAKNALPETPSAADVVPAPAADGRAEAERAVRERVRGKAREAVARMTSGIPGTGASLMDLIGARNALAGQLQELRLITASAPSDRALDGFVSRAESLAKDVAERIESTGNRILRKRMEAVTAFKATRNFDRAAKALDDLPEGFDQTSAAERLREEMAKVETARTEHARAEARHRDDGWTYVFTAASLDGWSGQGATALQLARDDELGYRYLLVRNPGPDEARLLFTAPGGEAWRNFKVRLDLRSFEGDLLIYVGKSGEDNGVFKIRVASKSVPKTDGWWTLQVEADGPMIHLRAGARLMGQVRNPAGSTGKIGFGLKAGSQVDIRNVRVKLAR